MRGLSVTQCNATEINVHKNCRWVTGMRNGEGFAGKGRPKNLGEVEQAVMDYVWTHGPCTSEACREALTEERPMKESTIRTVLRRLEEKGYVAHETSGRTFIYRAAEARQNVAARAVKSIIDRFCGGSAEQLVIGMVDNEVIDRKVLERLTRKIRKGS